MGKEYQSIEEKVWHNIVDSKTFKAGKETLKLMITGLYGGISTPFRIPTFIRKMKIAEIYIDRYKTQHISHDGIGPHVISGMAGILGDVIGLGYTIHQAFHQNHAPLIILGSALAITNAASGIYESARAPKRLEQVVEKPAEQPAPVTQ